MMSASEEITSKEAPKTISSFVFIDLETTDLIRNKNVPRITELALVAIDRDTLLIPHKKLPRIMSKLVIPINPNAKIVPRAAEMTKLSNHSLRNFKNFDNDVCYALMFFLERLPKPICFVAHCGNHFDFPVFVKEVREFDMEIPEEILSIDSIDVFKHYYKSSPVAVNGKTNGNIISNCNFLSEWDCEKDSWDDAFCAILDAVEKSESFDENTEFEEKNQESRKKIKKTEECSNFQTRGNMISSEVSKLRINNEPKNLKLETIFKFITGSNPENPHYAEDDCLSLIRCANSIGEYFIEFAENNAKPLSFFDLHTNN